MKSILKLAALFAFSAVTFTFCSEDKDDNGTTTSTTSTTSTTATTSTTGNPTSNFVTMGTTTVSLTSVACFNEKNTTINDSVSRFQGSDAGPTVIITDVYGANAAQGNYVSVDDENNLASGKCMVTITRTGAVDEILTLDPGQTVTLRVEGTKRTIEINGKEFDIKQGSTQGKRTVTTKYGCQ